ncbi:MAG TPA: phosphatase PAP2 family protein, partial [Pyrinomonadaceae bacterium]|nr:phosphatase PAP2 family protein [Pyrinomonadaceae bacterium]
MPNSLESIFSRTKLAFGSLLLSTLTVAIGGLIFFGWLTEKMSEGDTRGFDDAVRSFVHQYASPALTILMQIASFLGSTVFLMILGIGIFTVFWLLKRHRAAMLFAITMAGSSILLYTLKTVFRRARPEPFFETLLPASYSFPSGHSLLSFCFYGVLAAIITARIERRLFRVIVWACAALLVALIGLSRIYLGVHYPSDVLAGYTAAFVWVVAVAVTDR